MKHYRVILAIIFFLILVNIFLYSLSAHAAEINCYSHKTRIYHGYGNDFVFDKDFIAFTETKTNYFIMIEGECVILADEDGIEIDAINEG